MAIGSIYTKLRPLRIAFIVNPNDKKSLSDVIKINTVQWGGQHNFIVPLMSKVSGYYKNQAFGYNAKELMSNYLNLIDPDFIVPVCKFDFKKFNIDSIRIIEFKKFKDYYEGTRPAYGLGIFELMDFFWRKEFRFVRKNPIPIEIPTISTKNRLFLETVFGALPTNLEDKFFECYGKAMDINRPNVSISNYCKILDSQTLFLRRLSNLFVGRYLKRDWESCIAIYILNPDSNHDLINYWNLRAIGWSIFPVAVSSMHEEENLKSILSFVESNYVHHRWDKNTYRHVKVIKGMETSSSDFNKFVALINSRIEKPATTTQPKIVFQSWVPRLWIDWAIKDDHIERHELDTHTERTQFKGESDELDFEIVFPKFFDHEHRGGLNPLFANEIKYNFYGAKNPKAEIIPYGIKDIVFSYTSGRMSWRISQSSITYLASGSKETISLTVPHPFNIFREWFENRNYKIEKSYAGLIADQIHSQLEGRWGIATTIKRVGLIELLSKFKNNSCLSLDQLLAEAAKIANKQHYPTNAQALIDQIVESKILEFGFELQCPVCIQRNWYSLSEMDYQLKCYKCLSINNVPTHRPKEITMSYKANGPFSLPNHAYGTYSVVLANSFFSDTLDKPTTPVYSINLSGKKFANPIEIDLAMFFQESSFEVNETNVAFFECKTFNEFDSKDIKKMKLLGEHFPFSYLVFATLKDKLSSSEKKLIKNLVDSNAKKQKAQKSFNHILILTSQELLAHERPPDCWPEEIEKRYQHNYLSKVYLTKDLCVATQEIYL